MILQNASLKAVESTKKLDYRRNFMQNFSIDRNQFYSLTFSMNIRERLL